MQDLWINIKYSEREREFKDACCEIIAKTFPNQSPEEMNIRIRNTEGHQTKLTQTDPWRDILYLKWQKLKVKSIL